MANTHSTDLESSSSQYWSINDASQTGLDITGDITIEAWIKPESLTDFDVIISKDDVGVSRSFTLHLKADGAIHTYIFGVGGSGQIETETSAGIITAGVWSHIVMVFDVSADTVKIYLNGVETGYQTYSSGTITTITDSSAPFLIGARFLSSVAEKFFDGLVDEVRVWNDIRTESEIQDNFQKELDGDEANLQGYWKFNNDGDDETSNDNDLTNINSCTFSEDVPEWGVTLEMGVGSIALTGNDITLTYFSGYTLSMGVGALTLTGNALGLKRALIVAMGIGAFTLTGIALAFKKGFNIILNTVSFLLTGKSLSFRTTAWKEDSKPSSSWNNDSK